MPMGKGTYSKPGRPKNKFRGFSGITSKQVAKTASKRKATSGMKAGASKKANTRYDKILYGNTKRKKK